ncbi:UvrD-helicase domain-containing protein [Psychrobacter aestuarii]|uniref:RecBCD enzyme subunit RecB n=1 Tax=Psychrobacter aestuarii TaxID=556327 RepID=A0ABP3FHB4_9GAMM|nr:UvrD-helicase domain-containing protein [Psychrobacter aestuarii]
MPDTVTAQETPDDALPPALRVPLHGRYLIEASAGTGKTWTLTGIVLRLLIEAKRAPEHIIATTFTRAAAAEMRERIHGRLVDFYQLLQWVQKLAAQPEQRVQIYPQYASDAAPEQAKTAKDNIDNKKSSPDTALTDAMRQQRRDWLHQQAHGLGIADLINDPINDYLLAYLLDRTASYPLTEAIRRCALVLTTLDKLFVNTLDSLAQKWLSEYSAETGHQIGMAISEREGAVIESIIHDEIRAFQSQLYHDNRTVYDLLQHTRQLTTVADHLNVANKALQHLTLPITSVMDLPDIDFKAYQETLQAFKTCDLTDVEPYFDKDYRKAQGLNAGATLGKKIDTIYEIQSAVEKGNIIFFTLLEDEAQKFFDALPFAFLSKEEGGKGFNNNKETERLAFISIDAIRLLKKLHDYTEQIDQHLRILLDTLNRNIALSVRARLPMLLEAAGETTFGLQMLRLNQALAGNEGARLARYIRHHYPVALIDESQDINTEQAKMIERIYMPDSELPEHLDVQGRRNFLLLVGDPKQAIYGFRGGDVANYNQIKSKFAPAHRMSLDINRRSNAQMIESLNHWFGKPDEQETGQKTSAPNMLAALGQNIEYQYITAANPESNASWHKPNTVVPEPLRGMTSTEAVTVLHLPQNDDDSDSYDYASMTAHHIAALLASNQQLNGRALRPSDIAVLGRTKKDLQAVEKVLHQLGVAALVTTEDSVFSTVIAEDILVLLEAILRPQRRDIINRLLTSQFYQLSLQTAQSLIDSSDETTATEDSDLKAYYQHLQSDLKRAAVYWQHSGVLSALHYILGRNALMPLQAPDSQAKTLWTALAGTVEGTRHLMDLRHIMDILAQYAMHLGEYELLNWYKKQMSQGSVPEWAKQQPLPTASGVQLMTMHKSKGLEFPIVYALGLDSNIYRNNKKNTHALYLYDHDISVNQTDYEDQPYTERRLSASKHKYQAITGKMGQENYFSDFEAKEAMDELRRLTYVAMTRASEQLFVVITDAKSKRGLDDKPLRTWLDCPDTPEHTLPERLAPYIGWLGHDGVKDNIEAILQSSDAMNAAEGTADSTQTQPSSYIDYRAAEAQRQQHRFYGWAKTSFTALARQLTEQSHDLAVFDDAIEDDLVSSPMRVSESAQVGAAEDIRFSFVKGANAGTFLHQVLEKIDFEQPHTWSTVIDQGIRQYQLPNHYLSTTQTANQGTEDTRADDDIELPPQHVALKDWLARILATPLLASNQPLHAIAPRQRMAELGFNMGLAARFNPETLNAIFQTHLPMDTDKHIHLSSAPFEHIYRYLRGEIDLVYQHAGKYYVVDYKSNYLGSSDASYHPEQLQHAMSHAGYWLQAAIYQVALHRLLKLRITDYRGNEAQYLGAVEYVFLRGIGGDTQQGYGRITWDIPIALVLALDDFFGLPSR